MQEFIHCSFISFIVIVWAAYMHLATPAQGLTTDEVWCGAVCVFWKRKGRERGERGEGVKSKGTSPYYSSRGRTLLAGTGPLGLAGARLLGLFYLLRKVLLILGLAGRAAPNLHFLVPSAALVAQPPHGVWAAPVLATFAAAHVLLLVHGVLARVADELLTARARCLALLGGHLYVFCLGKRQEIICI